MGLLLSKAGTAGVREFELTDLPSLLAEWRFDEGTGCVIPNSAATGRSSEYVNCLGYPEDPATFIVSNISGSSTVTSNYGTGHDGESPSARFLTTSAYANKRASLTIPAGEYTLSCYVKSASVGVPGDFKITINNTSSSLVTTTDSWQRISLTVTNPTSIGLSNNASAPAVSDVVISGLQLELGSSATVWQRPQQDVVNVGSSSLVWENGGLSFNINCIIVGRSGASDLTAWTAHITFKQPSSDASSATNRFLMGTQFTSVKMLQLENSAGQLGSYAGGNYFNESGTTADDAWHILSCAYNGTEYILYLDGQAMFRTVNNFDFIQAQSKIIGRSALGYSVLYSEYQDVSNVHSVVQRLRTRMALRGQTITVPTWSLIWLGDSITQFNPGVWVAAKTRYPHPVYQTNLGVAGVTIEAMETVVWTPGVKNLLVLWIGTNNLANVTNSDGGGAAVAAKLKTTAQNLRTAAIAAGVSEIKIAIVTMLPRKTYLIGAGVTVESLEAQRTIYNNAIVADTSYYDYRIDVHLDPVMGTDPDAPDNASLFYDGTHLAQGGVDQLQSLFNDQLDAILV